MSGGIYMAKGMTLALTDISLRISDGKIDQASSTMNVKVGYDACIPWLEIALEHLTVARDITADSQRIWSGPDEKAKGELLGKEFRSSMQAIVAAAVSLDALYSNVRHRARTDKSATVTSKKGRAARPARIAETLRTAFSIQQESFENLRNYLEQIYEFRDKAVHPAGEFTAPVLHTGMKASVEWRFVTFRYENALPIVQVTIEIISQLAAKGHPTNKQLQEYCAYLKTLIDPLRELFPIANPHPDSAAPAPS